MELAPALLPTDPTAPDPAAAVERRARQFAEAHTRFEAARDGRAVCVLGFSMMYAELARRLRAEVAGIPYGGPDDDGGTFDDPAWVGRLADTFAGLAFDAFEGIDRACACEGVPDFTGVSKPWADAWRASALPGATVLEDLLCGLVAHIGHDLPVALATVGLESHGSSRVRDFHRLNGVLADLTDSVQRRVSERYNHYLLRLDRLAAGADEALTALGMQLTRALAWYNAVRLLDPLSADEARRELEGCTIRTLNRLRRPRKIRYRVLAWCGRTLLRGRRRWPTAA